MDHSRRSLMMSEKTEADEIDALIETFCVSYGDWCGELFNDVLRLQMNAAEQALRDKIQSIISERDALRAAMQSHRKALR